MRPMFAVNIVPSLPPALVVLKELAYNLWWAWNPEAIELFRRLDREGWESSGHNPVQMLGTVEQASLESAAQDDGFMSHLERVYREYQRYMTTTANWYHKHHGAPPKPYIAYFCFEYGLTDCLTIYSGGMGVLAGDYLKSASDLGIPMVAVGLLYQRGYFRQYLNADGWQGERYPELDPYNLPLRLEKSNGLPLLVEVDFPDRRVTAQVWCAEVGRVPLYLLDTNVPQNRPEDMRITHQLYGGDADMRIRQEIVLGVGGLRALRALGFSPRVCHMNEGHSAFLALEWMRKLVRDEGLTYREAEEVVRAGCVFTTHTSVPAGIDLFGSDMIDRYFGHYYEKLGVSRSAFLALGRHNPVNEGEPLNMAVLALKLSNQANAVSQMHGGVSRRLWQNLWPGVPEREVPIISINNGVHIRSWVSQDLGVLFDRYLGPRWAEQPVDQRTWDLVAEIPDDELWRVRDRRRARLVAFARRRLRAQLEQRGALSSEIAHAMERLDPEAFTIGFARRFAKYKRATLLLREPERLSGILNNKERPVQIIFAGKAHPQDTPAKELIRQLVHLSKSNGLDNLVFIEDYDLTVARYLMQGVDLWLNTPLLRQEASGTSGMKAAVNGALNLSVLDGWWADAYQPEIGWAVGRGEEYEDLDYQEQVESNAIYVLLEKEIVPLFYKRGSDGLPRGWIEHMKDSIGTVAPAYGTNRMVIEYMERLYRPADKRYQGLTDDGFSRAKKLAEWKARVRQQWPEVRVLGVETSDGNEFAVGSDMEVRASVRLGQLGPEDVSVELYEGTLDANQEIVDGRPTAMSYASVEKGVSLFVCPVRFQRSGRHGYTVRVLPRHMDLANPFEPRLIVWGAN
jgi:starch phosphorylase